jgi:hypothetical protein
MSIPINIKGQESGLLTAVKPSHTEHGQGVIWDCLCSGPKCGGKGTRKVLAKDFRQKKIKRCLQCANTNKRVGMLRNSSKRWAKEVVTGPMYSDEFRRSYRDHIAEFTREQRMLFDVIMDGRTNYAYQVQAADIVLRAVNVRAEIESLIADNPKRWQRYLERQRFQKHNKTELKRVA